MTSKEEHIINDLITAMLKTHFQTKQAMAQALNLSEEALDQSNSLTVLDCLLHYCISNAIPLEPFLTNQ